jgi:hypothetical protein
MKTKETTKKTSTKKENKNVDNATTNVILNNIVEEKKLKVQERNFLYSFERLNLSDKESKRNRTKLRRDLKLLVNNITICKDKEKLKELTNNFINFYKTNYILNDFSIESLTKKTNLDEIADYLKVLQIAKDSLK